MKTGFLLITLTLTLPLAGARAQTPNFNTQPASLSLTSGQAAVFKVTSTNSLSYEWRKDNTPLALTERVSGVAGPILSISPALAGDAGVYSVILSNADGVTTSDPARLWMNLALPSFLLLLPQSQTNAAGGTASFTVAVSGSEPITYRWVRYGTPLSDDGRITGATTTNLAITTLSSTDSGWYWLTASNAGGAVACNPARLTVLTDGELGAAANYPEGAWTTSSWLAQTAVTHDGVSALRSGPIADNSSTYVETTVYGPGEVSFYWAVSCEKDYDGLNFQLDGAVLDNISEQQPSWTQRTFAVGWGPHVVRWVYHKDNSTAYGYDSGFLDQVTFSPTPLVSLEIAAASIPLPLRTYGDAAWFGQTATNHDGNSAARCGYITHNQSSTLETTVAGPGWISFAWKVSSEYADPLSFLVDGVAWEQIATEVDWTNRTFHIPWGLHTLGWRYQKDHNDNAGARGNAAWLDEVAFTPVGLSDLATASGLISAPWTSGGALPWFGQNEFTFDGTDALMSGPITHNQTSFVDTSFAGPGTLTFRWKVSSEDDDSLRFLLDGVEQIRLATEVNWTAVTNVVRPGSHAFRWQYVKDYNINAGTDAGWLDAVTFVPAPSLPVAVNAPLLNWATSGDAAWFPEMVTTHDGIAAGHSGDIGDHQSSTLTATVNGPGTLAYWWRVSSEYSDPLIFLVDGVEQARISGEVGWTNLVFNVTNGTHTLSWRYQKDGSSALGADAGWLDQVSFTSTSMQLSNPSLNGDSFTLTTPSALGKSYVLEFKNALNDPYWTPLPGVPGTGLPLLLTDSAATNAQRFYRVVMQ